MRHWALWGAACAGVFGLVGCGWMPTGSSSQKGGVAVIDLREVAQAVGASSQVTDMIKFREASLNTALGKLTTDLKEKIEEKKAEFGEELSEEQTKSLQQDALAAGRSLQQARQQAQANLSKYTADLEMTFRAKVRPIAQEIAAKKGYSVVIPKNEALLLSVAPESDITNDVIVALQSLNEKSVAEPKPAPEAKEAKDIKETGKESKPAKKKVAEGAREKAKSGDAEIK